jgi:hypothetical protein
MQWQFLREQKKSPQFARSSGHHAHGDAGSSEDRYAIKRAHIGEERTRPTQQKTLLEGITVAGSQSARRRAVRASDTRAVNPRLQSSTGWSSGTQGRHISDSPTLEGFQQRDARKATGQGHRSTAATRSSLTKQVARPDRTHAHNGEATWRPRIYQNPEPQRTARSEGYVMECSGKRARRQPTARGRRCCERVRRSSGESRPVARRLLMPGESNKRETKSVISECRIQNCRHASSWRAPSHRGV